MKELLAAVAVVVALLTSGTIYPQTFVVTDVTDNEVILTTSSGHEYHYSVPVKDLPDYIPGSVVSAVMHNAGTPGDTADDVIMKLSPSGFVLGEPNRAEVLEM